MGISTAYASTPTLMPVEAKALCQAVERENADRSWLITIALPVAAACLLLAALADTVAWGQDAPPAARVLHIVHSTPPASPYATDEEIGKAIAKAADFLISHFEKSKLLEADFLAIATKEAKEQAGEKIPEQKACGGDFLAVYALIQAGKATNDPRLEIKGDFLKGLLDAMKTIPIGQTACNYNRGLRCAALSAANRPEDREVLAHDAQWLIDACHGGAYGYTFRPDPHPAGAAALAGPPAYARAIPLGWPWDNSNSQYGLLGVWSAALAGAEVSDEYWHAVEKHWVECQHPDGQWSYNAEAPTYRFGGMGCINMTVAGLASLFVCHDFLDRAAFTGDVAREPFTPALAKGLSWLETGDNSVLDPGTQDLNAYAPYGCYGLERVGLASGFKYFGKHDWYREISTKIIKLQRPDGSFASGTLIPVVETSYLLLFLARGRHAILMNKLRFDHYWNNRPHDLLNLARFAGRELETEFNWQVVTPQPEWSDWLDAPILYIASNEAPKLRDEDYARIRSYVDAGGMLFTQADGSARAFNDYADKVLLKKVFPDYELLRVPLSHGIYSIDEPVKNPPPLLMVTNGARPLWIHCPQDLSATWQRNAVTSKADNFHLGLNLFIYAAGKTNFRRRVDTNFIPAPPAAAPDNTITVARVKYAMTTWDPEPYAWPRFANWLGWETGVGVKTQATPIADLGKLAPADIPMAHLTGTNPYTVTDDEALSLRSYVENGGVLFIDSCGGAAFNDSIDALLAKAFPGADRKRVAATDPLLSVSAEGMSDLGIMELRPFARKTIARSAARINRIDAGKGCVLYTNLDLTNGLLGSRIWGIIGFDTPAAQGLLKNILLWSARGRH